MAGKEARGVEAADADLFRGRPWVLTSPEPELERWIANIGARLAILPAAEHDRLVAMVSHLPQLISTALASTFAHEPDVARIAGPAAIDLTRLALSPYDIWRDILATNTAEIDAALAGFIARLAEIRDNLTKQPAMAQEFENAAAAARALRRPS
jgi:prephenate dehydrogenase